MAFYRSLFISDIHLGSPHCKIDKLLEFIKNNDCKFLYLVGDIIDFWALMRHSYWIKEYNEFLHYLQIRTHYGMRIIYTPGNHDKIIRKCQGTYLGIKIQDQVIHHTNNKEKYLVLHGDQFDKFGANRMLANLVRPLHEVARWIRIHNWSSDVVDILVRKIEKRHFKLKNLALSKGCSGVIFGHEHMVTIHDDNGFKFMNTGDWVNSCTAIAETMSGEFKILTI